MDAIQKNDSIILKGTNFKSKPMFATIGYPKFDDLVRDLMLKYGESISDGHPIKGKENLFRGVGSNPQFRPVPIPLQPYFLPFYYTTLLVVGSDDCDTLVLTSPMEENVRKLFGFSRWSRKAENYDSMLKTIESDTKFIPLTYDCTLKKMEKDWHKTVHLRKRDTVQLYVVPKPLEYFPMLFINCSMENIRNIYDNVTALMIFNNYPVYYTPFSFTCAIFRPILFNIIDNRLEFRRRLPGLDVTEEEYVLRRTEWLIRQCRYMVSDCRCRSNTAVLPPGELNSKFSWNRIESLFYCYYCNTRASHPPLYTQTYSNCNGHCGETKE